MTVEQIHEERETLTVDVNIPGHDPRKATALFERTRRLLIAREGGRCWVCGRTAEESGHPLEAHHHPIERSFAEMIDWSPGSLIRRDFPAFDWAHFDPTDPYSFVDDMTVNGRLLCKDHHIGRDEGIHALPYPIWLAQRYGKAGYKFSDIEIIHHDQEAGTA
ncbi:HNH endonuclease [Castellaniella sp. UC4442_H9]